MAPSVQGDEDGWLYPALEAIGLGLFVKDSQGRYLYANAAYRALIGREDCAGRTDAELGVGGELALLSRGRQLRVVETGFSPPGGGRCTAGFVQDVAEASDAKVGEPTFERRMLARLLHDSVAQHLTGLMLRAEAFNQSLLQAVEDVRRLTAALSPPRLEEGLLPALRLLCGPDTVLEVSGVEGEVELSLQTLLCDVLQEQALCCPWPARSISIDMSSSVAEVRMTYDTAKFDLECALRLATRALGLGGQVERSRTEHQESMTLRFPRR